MSYEITSDKALERLVLDWGFLPFFKNDIPGFSVEEHTPPELWFSDVQDGPWEWKGPVARAGRCAYGKLFRGRAGFVSLEWLPELANYRRDGYDFDSRCDEGLVPMAERQVGEAVLSLGPILTKTLKAHCGYDGEGGKGFDGVITRLQMQTYVCAADFEYVIDKNGQRRGWGMAKYASPEALFGQELVTSAYVREPEESRLRCVERLRSLLPGAGEKQLEKLIR